MEQDLVSPVLPLLLNLQMLADSFSERDIVFSLRGGEDVHRLRDFKFYLGQEQLEEQTLYLLEKDEQNFPTNQYTYLTAGTQEGSAPHLAVADYSVMQLANLCMEIFQEYRDFELELNSLVSQGGSLNDLCNLGMRFFHNPMYIHDNVFMVIGTSDRVDGMVELDYNPATGQYHIPLSMIEDFKFNSAYIATLKERHAAIWGLDQYPYSFCTLYVNIMDGTFYRGRLLINELLSKFTVSQFYLAEYLASYINLICRRDEQRSQISQNQLKHYIDEGSLDPEEIVFLLTVFGWREHDQYLCAKIRSQQAENLIMSESALRGKLDSEISDCVSLLADECLYVIVNQTKSALSVEEVSHILAPMMRESLMYCGISNPVSNFHQIPNGFRQAEIALQQPLRRRDSAWLVPFSSCAMYYIINHVQTDLPLELLISPAVLFLYEYDQHHGTDYLITLRVFLQCNCNATPAAEKVMIHRTTLLYRIDKIRQMVRVNLEDDDSLMYLRVSFLLLDRMLLEQDKNILGK